MAERERVQRLASTVATIQARWGERALVSAREAPRQGDAVQWHRGPGRHSWARERTV